MEQYKQEFIEFMVDSCVLKFGDFTFKRAGADSPVLYECGRLCDGQPAAQAGRILCQGDS